MWAEVRGAGSDVLRSDLVLWCHGTSLALNLPLHGRITDVSLQRWVQMGGCAEAVLLCL